MSVLPLPGVGAIGEETPPAPHRAMEHLPGQDAAELETEGRFDGDHWEGGQEGGDERKKSSNVGINLDKA